MGWIKRDKLDLLGRIVLWMMLFWLIYLAKSSTALVCLILGTSLIIFMQFPFGRSQVKHLGIYGLAFCFMGIFLYIFPVVTESLVDITGRDMTLTGRTYLWMDLIKAPINPLLGTGYQGFWLGPFAEHLWKKYSFHPNQAHNGYLETYLNIGLFGVCLLMAMIISTGRKLKKALLLKSNYGTLRLSFFTCALFYNFAEAMFSGLSLIWFLFLITALNYKRPQSFLNENAAKIVKRKLNRQTK